ncbi:hypothetical protein B0H14DRAFT_3164381 [Mycena olivaceomarginata]|nr:hypothetical protein B0H14DRAFT_3164381 [Mycena olivaceomarginata]
MEPMVQPRQSRFKLVSPDLLAEIILIWWMPRIRVIPPLASLLPQRRPTTSASGVGRIVWVLSIFLPQLSFKCTAQAHMGCTATLFPTVPTAPIPPAGAQDPLQLQLRAKPRSEPIVPVEPSEAPIRQLRKRTRTHNPSAPSLQPGKARKRAKKGGEKELNLDWGLVAGGKHCDLKMCFTQVEFNCLNQNGRLGLKMGTRFLQVSTPR